LGKINKIMRIIKDIEEMEKMPAPLLKDPRERIIAAKERGTSHAKLARELRVRPMKPWK
jgi:hypothetical protein